MKAKLVLLTFSSLFILNTHSQNYNSTAVEGVHWIVVNDYVSTPYPIDGLWEYYATGDTLIGNKVYKKIFKRELSTQQEFPPFEPVGDYELHGLLRDDTINKRLYAIQFSNINSGCPANAEYVLFDFSFEIGDTVDLCASPVYSPFVIQNIYTEDILGFSTKVFEGVEYLYEGMGSNYGLFEDMFAPVKKDEKYLYRTTLYYYCRETPCNLLLSTDEPELKMAFEIFPNPASEILYIKKPGGIVMLSLEVYNHLGQIKFQSFGNYDDIDVSSFEKGIYFLKIESENKIFRQKFLIE